MLFIGLTLVAITAVYYFLKSKYNYWRNQNVPTTNPPILFGDSWDMMMKKYTMTGWMLRLYNMFPESRYTGLFQFWQPTLLIRDPELAKQILVKDFDHFMDHQSVGNEDTDPLMGKNLINLKGNRWKHMRGTLSPSFTSSKMRTMFVLMEQVVDDFIAYFKKQDNNKEIEMKDTFTRFTNDVIASAAFGIRVNSLEEKENEFYLMGRDATDFTSTWKGVKLFLMMIIPQIAKYLGLTVLGQKVNDYFIDVIRVTLKERREKNIVRPDVINILLEAQKGNAKQETEKIVETSFATVEEMVEAKEISSKTEISDIDITAQALIFFFAGFDTVSTAMSFMSYELAANPDIQAKLREEIDEVAEETNGKLTYESVLKMKYLDMVVCETLRKWPAAIFTDRMCTKPLVIEPTRPGESRVELKVGSTLMIPIVGFHYDPKYYPEPELFDPERFNDDNKKNINPYTYMPFGVGPRACIGNRFALLELKLIFYHLLRNFEISIGSKMQLPVKLSRNLTPCFEGGTWLRFKPIR